MAATSAASFADRIQATYEKAEDISIDFVQKTYVAVLEKEVKKKGEAKFKKPGKLAIAYAGVGGRHYVSDGKSLWYYEAGDSQVQKVKLDEESISPEALSFLGGLGQLKRDFAVEEVEAGKLKELKPEKPQLQWLELTPLKKRSSLQWLVMGFDPDSAVAQEVFLYTDSGNLSHYIFNQVRWNTGLPDDLFQYKKSN